MDKDDPIDENRILKFISDKVNESKTNGTVVGLSGGVDSSVVAYLCVKALGKDKVVAMSLPSKYTPKENIADAELIATNLQVKSFVFMPLEPILDVLGRILSEGEAEVKKAVWGNVQARLRMLIQYYYANKYNLLVVGTTDRTEDFLGYYTKYGDGGVDMEPIIHLTKTEVRQLGRQLCVPSHICNKRPSPNLWEGHEAEKELGIDYELVDRLLKMNALTDHKRRIPDSVKRD